MCIILRYGLYPGTMTRGAAVACGAATECCRGTRSSGDPRSRGKSMKGHLHMYAIHTPFLIYYIFI